MGGVGRAWRKAWRAVGKVLKKVSKAIGLHYVLKKLGLTGKHVKHTYVVVQPLSPNYEKDKIKTMLATGIASGAELSEHMRESLAQSSGVKLLKYYEYTTRRIKIHNFQTKIALGVEIPQLTIDVDPLIRKHLTDFKDKPYIVIAYSFEPSEDGSLWRFMETFNRDRAMLNTHYRRGVWDNLNNDMYVDADIPATLQIKIDEELIPVIDLGSLNNKDQNGNVTSKRIYVGGTDVTPKTVPDSSYCYFYNEDVPEVLKTELSYFALLVPNKVTMKSEEPMITTKLDPTDTREEGTVIEYDPEPIIDDMGEYSMIYKETTTVIRLNGSDKYQDVTVKWYVANSDDPENLKILWANETEESHTGLWQDIQNLIKNEKDVIGEAAESNIDLAKKFNFYPYIPLKQNSQYTIKFKGGDPYAGVAKPSDREKRKTEDPEQRRDPRLNNRVTQGVKPRTVTRRLRKDELVTINSRLKRKYTQASLLLEQSYESLVGQLMHGEGDMQTHYSCILPSVCLNSKVQEVKKYWYQFAKHIYKYVHNKRDKYALYNTKDIITQSQLDTYVIGLFNKGILHSGNQVNGKWVIEAKVPVEGFKATVPTFDSISAYNDTDGAGLSHSLSYNGIVHFQIEGNLKPKKKKRHKNYFEIKIGRNPLLVGKPTEVDCEITVLGRDATYFSATYKVLSTPTVQAINPSVFEWVDSYTEYSQQPDATHKNAMIIVPVTVNVEETFYDNNVAYYTCFCRQLSKNRIDIYALQGLQSMSLVQGHGTAVDAYEFLFNPEIYQEKGFYNMFVMPICHDVLKRSGLINNTRFSSRVVQRVDFSTYDQYIPWYARSAFKVVLNIIQVVLFVLTIYTGGSGAYFVEAFKQGIYAGVRQVITQFAIQIAISIAVQQIIKLVAKVFGGKVAAILGAIAAVVMTVYGTSTATGMELPYASQVMLVTPAIVNGSNTVMANLMKDVQKQIEVETESFNKAMESLEEERNYMEEYVYSGIDTVAFVAALQTRVEKLDTFLERTLLVNMNQFTDLQYLANSLDIGMYIDYDPELGMNWSGVPTDNSVPDDWETNPTQFF